MNSRERILSAINQKKIDRIPTDIWATYEVQMMLKERFGTLESAYNELHIDGFSSVNAEYIGPALPEVPDGECINFWGIRNRSISHGSGEYNEQFFFPLAQAKTIDDLENFEWPKADWFDYSQIKEIAKENHDNQAIMCGYMAPFYYHNLLRGLEKSLMDPHDDAEFTHHLINRISDFFYEHHYRMFEACDGLIDVSQVTDDLGSQNGPMISIQTFKEFYKPHMKKFIDLCHNFNIKVFHHDDGAIRMFIPDLIELGIDILNPVQWNCPGMDRIGLKKDFGDKLCFHGAIENQSILPFGTPEDVRTEVRRSIDELASDGTGYILAPCHNLQSNTPIDNIIAMYDEAWNYGKL